MVFSDHFSYFMQELATQARLSVFEVEYWVVPVFAKIAKPKGSLDCTVVYCPTVPLIAEVCLLRVVLPTPFIF